MTTDPASPSMLLKRAANRLGRPFGVNPFPRAFDHPLAGEAKPVRAVFDQIFEENYWGSTESRSGVGSEIGFANSYKDRLRELLSRHGMKRIFDAPSGDMNWIAGLITEAGLDYTGGDISPRVVENARREHPGFNVQVFDIATDPFPDADVWHCRDCLFHLPHDVIRQALGNFSRSSIPYALITSHRARVLHKNLDVRAGGFRYLDLQRAPFLLPRPIASIPDFVFGRDFPRYVCLWSREQIIEALETAR
jgi:hypothetical protein